MTELRTYLEDVLRSNGFKAGLENMNESDLNFKISKSGYISHLSISRITHRPLEVEIEVDYDYYRAQKASFKQQQKRNRSRQRSGTSMYRMFWLFWIFGGIILAALAFVSQLIFAILEAVTPGLTSQTRGFVFVGLAIIAFLVWIFAIPTYIRNQNRRNQVIDREVLHLVEKSLADFDNDKNVVTQLKCWNCFQTISTDDIHCAHCGVKQK